MNLGDAVLEATRTAGRFHRNFHDQTSEGFDVLGAAMAIGIPIMFRPLKNLLGACITVDGSSGIIVTTNRDRHLQRFTLAHELGHLQLGHQESLDAEVGLSGRYQSGRRPITEVAADTFASELLCGRRVILPIAKRNQWGSKELMDPANIYQLSLRIGVSYQATCWALAAQTAITQAAARQLQGASVKDLKRTIASPDLIEDPWADVWRLSESDDGRTLEASPGDIFSLEAQELASAGYRWHLDADADCDIIGSFASFGSSCGGPTTRKLQLRFQSVGTRRLYFEHRRPWNKQGLGHIDIQVRNYGKEEEGLPRRVREAALAGAR